MADEDHLNRLRQGVDAWNAWRAKEPSVRVDLRGANLRRADLRGANLRRADLRKANLSEAVFSGASLTEADLGGADLSSANLSEASFLMANLFGAELLWANLRKADLGEADLRETLFYGADLSEAYLAGADLSGASLRDANLSGVCFERATLVGTDIKNANLTDCRIYGISTWDLKLNSDTKQQNLLITPQDEPEITVDNIEVAQFVYLLLHNEKIRNVIDTIGKKAVVILGRFTEERKKVLNALRDELRRHDYLPILFDFEKPASKDLTGTVLTLAHMARFIIADLTDPSSVPYEVSKVADAFVPIQPILLSGKSEFAMFVDMQRRHHWVLTTRSYNTQEELIANFDEWVIRPAEAKVLELRGPQPG